MVQKSKLVRNMEAAEINEKNRHRVSSDGGDSTRNEFSEMQNLDCQLQCVGGGNSTYTFGKPTAWTWEDSTIGSLLRSQFDGIRYKYTSIKRPTKRTPRLFLTLRTSSVDG